MDLQFLPFFLLCLLCPSSARVARVSNGLLGLFHFGSVSNNLVSDSSGTDLLGSLRLNSSYGGSFTRPTGWPGVSLTGGAFAESTKFWLPTTAESGITLEMWFQFGASLPSGYTPAGFCNRTEFGRRASTPACKCAFRSTYTSNYVAFQNDTNFQFGSQILSTTGCDNTLAASYGCGIYGEFDCPTLASEACQLCQDPLDPYVSICVDKKLTSCPSAKPPPTNIPEGTIYHVVSRQGFVRVSNLDICYPYSCVAPTNIKNVNWYNTTFQVNPPIYFTSAINPTVFPGTITVFTVALYNRTLTLAEMDQNYQAWLPNSVPVISAVDVNVPQDVVTRLNFSYYDFDKLYATTERDNITMTISVPVDGNLYRNGVDALDINPTGVTFNPETDVISYRSRQYGYDDVITLSYSANDGTGSSSSSNYVLRVQKVPTPPILSESFTPIVEVFRGEPLSLQLNCFSPWGEIIKSFNIINAAAAHPGVLSDDDFVPITSASTNLTNITQPSRGESVTTLNYQTQPDSPVGFDNFTWTCSDGIFWSQTFTVSILVKNKLQTYPASFSLEENSAGLQINLKDPLYSIDFKGLSYNLVVTSIPPTSQGWLTDASGANITAGLLNYTLTNGVLTYHPTYNTPYNSSSSYTTMFDFYIQQGLFYSASATITLTVTPVNDAPTITTTTLNVTATEGEKVMVNWAVVDPDGADSLYRVKIVASPSAVGNVMPNYASVFNVTSQIDTWGLVTMLPTYTPPGVLWVNRTRQSSPIPPQQPEGTLEFRANYSDLNSILANIEITAESPGCLAASADAPCPGRGVILCQVFDIADPPSGIIPNQPYSAFGYIVYDKPDKLKASGPFTLTKTQQYMVWGGVGFMLLLCLICCRACCVQYRKWVVAKGIEKHQRTYGYGQAGAADAGAPAPSRKSNAYDSPQENGYGVGVETELQRID